MFIKYCALSYLKMYELRNPLSVVLEYISCWGRFDQVRGTLYPVMLQSPFFINYKEIVQIQR